VLEKMVLGQDFSEYLGFSAIHSTNCLTFIIIYHTGLV
jgi:hypothetical protein